MPHRPSSSGHGPAPRVVVLDDGYLVERDGFPQSFVSLADPLLLGFEYIQLMACVLAAAPPGRLRTTHVGGGGLTLPRWVQAVRPGSPQVVLEADAALTTLVRAQLPLPRGHRIRVRAVDGATGMRTLADGSADAVVVDAYAGGRMPGELATTGFLADCARVLGPDGVAIFNVADEPGLAYARRVLAGLGPGQGYASRLLLGTHEVLKGRRFGNAVLVGCRGAFDEVEVAAQVRRCGLSAAVRGEAEVARMVAGCAPFCDREGDPSPVPPDPGRWRLR